MKKCCVVLDGEYSVEYLHYNLECLLSTTNNIKVFCVAQDYHRGRLLDQWGSVFFQEGFLCSDRSSLFELLERVDAEFTCVAYVPCSIPLHALSIEQMARLKSCANALELILPPGASDLSITKAYAFGQIGWIASLQLARRILFSGGRSIPHSADFGVSLLGNCEFTDNLRATPIYGWNVMPQIESKVFGLRNGEVCGVIPHFCCEHWLEQCLRSLVRQTHRLASIVVLDDCSETSPYSIVEKFPEVTLLQASHRMGPEALVNSWVGMSAYKWYLMQDADDFSAIDRTELMLAAAEKYGSQLVGTQEIRLDENCNKLSLHTFPLSVNLPFIRRFGHYMLHGSCLFSREIFDALNGFRTQLKCSGDTDFQYRSSLIARCVNIPFACYVRRIRDGSMTRSPSTGLGSLNREVERAQLEKDHAVNRLRVSKGKRPIHKAARLGAVCVFKHIIGPKVLQ